jgi:hypothetical protein
MRMRRILAGFACVACLVDPKTATQNKNGIADGLAIRDAKKFQNPREGGNFTPDAAEAA